MRGTSLERKGGSGALVDILELLNHPALKPALPLDVPLCEVTNSMLVRTGRSLQEKQTRGETPVHSSPHE